MSIRALTFGLCCLSQIVSGTPTASDLEKRIEKLRETLSERTRLADMSSTANGRLTLTSGTAVTTSDVSAAGTLYYTRYQGTDIALYDGQNWKNHSFSEVSLALTMTADYNYDVFLYNNNGTLTMELSSAWNVDGVTRTDALALQDGVYVKSGATTKRYLGTIRASGTNVTEDSVSKRFVWNVRNRVRRKLFRSDATASWSFATSSWRALRNSSANAVYIVVGLAESYLNLTSRVLNWTATLGMHGIGEDSSITPVSGADGMYAYSNNANRYFNVTAYAQKIPAIGYHYYQMLENSTGTTTYYGGDDCKLIGNIDA